MITEDTNETEVTQQETAPSDSPPPATAAGDDPVETKVKKKKRTSKTWYVLVKSANGNEREERVTGVTTPEDAMALVTPGEDETVTSARPVRVYK